MLSGGPGVPCPARAWRTAAACSHRWDAWEAVKGKAADSAKLEFVKTYYEFPPASVYDDTRGGVTA